MNYEYVGIINESCIFSKMAAKMGAKNSILKFLLAILAAIFEILTLLHDSNGYIHVFKVQVFEKAIFYIAWWERKSEVQDGGPTNRKYSYHSLYTT